MDTEEILIKLGFKTDELSQGAQRIKNEMQQAGEHSELAFVHAESRGRAFKKVLHEISDVSPLMGIGLRLALDPIVGIMIAITQAFKDFEAQNEKITKAVEADAKRRTGKKMEEIEAAEKANAVARKGAEAQEEFERKLGAKSPAERVKESMDEGTRQAKTASESDGEFARNKVAIDQAGERVAGIEEEFALEQERATAASVNDRQRALDLERLKNGLKALKEAEKEAVEQGFGVGMEKESMVNFLTLGVVNNEQANALKKSIGTDRENLLADLRQKLEEELAGKETALERDKAQLAEQKQNVTELHQLKQQFHRQTAEDQQKAVEEERKARHEAMEQSIKEAKELHQHNEVAFLKEKISVEQKAKAEAEANKDSAEARKLEKELRLDAIRLRNAEQEQARHQAHFDRDLALERRKRVEAERQPYMPALQELANSMPWTRDVVDEARRRGDALTMRMGTAYGQKFARDAQDLERLKDDARRALFVEGPESTRFKEDVMRIESLKKGLATSGLQSGDDKLDAISRGIDNLVERAAKDGLVVQPVNGV